MSNPFQTADFDQPELEVLQTALEALMNRPEEHILPQHREAYQRVIAKMWTDVRELVRASSTSRDGSWFDDEVYRGKL